jgi:N-acetylglucosaminyldiphosphoundecaprenol N-acetyl-beta-D-mannosaminyltransferase
MKQPRTAATTDSAAPRPFACSRAAIGRQTQREHLSSIDLPTVWVGGVRLHRLTEAQCVDHIIEQLSEGCGGWMVTLNLDHLRLFSQQPQYAALCSQASLTVADGMPLVWASYLEAAPLPERIAGSNLIWNLTAAAAKNGRAIFLLGGSPGTAEAAAAALQQRYPDLQVAGTLCPAIGFDNDAHAIAQLTRCVSTAAPDLVYVGLGKPKQDLLIKELRAKLPNVWFIGVGVSFSFVCGAVRRAPMWMQHLGLEWLHRLVLEPQRLAKRYLVYGVPVAVRLLAGSAIRRLRHPARS